MTGASAIEPQDEEGLRGALRAWLAEHLTDEFLLPGGGRLTVEEKATVQRAWERELHAGGWLGRSWPRRYGGRDEDAWSEVTVREELARVGAPEILNVIGFTLVAPLLLAHGTEGQRERYLPAILSGDELWCQGFSEPDAGSDLASLRTRAVDAGDHYLVTGQKVWTSWAQLADRCLLLVRTDPEAPKHAGITVVLADLHRPGVDVRPIRQITGESEFCEVFFEGLRVDRRDVIGSPGEGWALTRETLTYERGRNFENLARLDVALARTVDRFKTEGATLDGETRARLRADLLDVFVEVRALREFGRQYLEQLQAGTANPAESSIIKLLWSELEVRVRTIALELNGPSGVAWDPTDLAASAITSDALASRAGTIYGGTSEIQRNIIGEQLLGLPRA